MRANFTPEDLIRYLYLETSPEENAFIEQALEQDAGLKAEWQQLLETKLSLDEDGREGPHPSTLERIFAHSAEKSLQETH